MRTRLNKRSMTRDGNTWETTNTEGEDIKVSFKNGLIRIYSFDTIYFTGYPNNGEEITTEQMIDFVNDRSYNIKFH